MNSNRLLLLYGLLLFVSSCKNSSENSTPLYNLDKELSSSMGMVSTAHPLASDAGAKVLSMGGNAIDAMVAVHMTLAVVYPRAGNLGGGGFMVYRNSKDSVNTLDFREMAPGLAERNMYLNMDDEVIPGLSTEGILAVGIPGSVRGMYDAHIQYGTVSWKELFDDAIRLAKKGHPITELEAERLNKYAPDFRRFNNDDIPFIKNTPWQEGDTLTQARLAETLERIASLGPKDFYQGETAQAILKTSQDNMGLIRQIDLDDYETVWRKPIHVQYKGHDIYSMPPPSSGGIALAQLLQITSNLPEPLPSFHSADHIHRMAETSRLVFEDRAYHLGDMDYYPVPIDSLLDPGYLKMQAATISLDTARKSQAQDISNTRESYETTHYSIVDKEGNAVSVTTTLNGNYGSKLFVEEAGFFLNNEMDDFSAKPGTPNMFGLIGAEANAIEPGKRMLSSMTPTIVTKDDSLFCVLGTPGGSTIITTVFQVIHAMIDYNMDLKSAVDAPRFHHQWLPDRIVYEEGHLDENIKRELKSKGHEGASTRYIGLVDAIYYNNGVLTGVADRRGDDDVEAPK